MDLNKKLTDYFESNAVETNNVDDTVILEIKKDDESYPYLLKQITRPPKVLYAIGNTDILNKPAIGIAGTRNPSEIGKFYARKVAEFFSEKGFVIVSGLAKGVDAIAIETALNCGANVIAVLPSIENITPKENKDLAKRILKQDGLIISEFKNRRIKKYQFIERNRIISGISLGIVVVESDIVGGTMHTVRFAKEQRRPIIVADVDAEGNKRLIEEGFPVFRVEA
ncbi:putative Rossmann fold protein nucleotide-binding protein involved in DNA uptake [Archaeoglobus fulgidus DSM 8774]|uniref:Putative Rossmann fold protein nucleotide-binding protein involved in DNA uptake n=1 Tax=Archaeoglobus fulgidus DSM 8774 TaxID=1344584 RepID=A0A075WBR7_ARCFL|nr:DNA-processing protein DprA [Archaeoglobus fulgidus]AIG97406.1 putative Rossmann fold protein nucleotide-binding protein involved in DNA uptake [Archaeoglobus fulgidus DSM 8774]